jgi:hypothetical protein
MERPIKKLRVRRDSFDGEIQFIDQLTDELISDLEAMDLDPELVIAVAPERAVQIDEHKVFKVLLEMSPYATAKTLRKMEQTSFYLRNFIQKRKLWRSLFQKKFPRHYIEASEFGEMKPHVKDLLDKYSMRPRVNETYWKRYYELLTRDNLDFGGKYFKGTITIPFHTFAWKSDIWVGKRGEIPIPYTFVLYEDMDYNNSVLYIWPEYIDPDERSFCKSQNMIRVDFISMSYSIVKNDKKKAEYEYTDHVVGKEYHIEQNDITLVNGMFEYCYSYDKQDLKIQVTEIMQFNRYADYYYDNDDDYDIAPFDDDIMWNGVLHNSNLKEDSTRVSFYRHADPKKNNIVFAMPYEGDYEGDEPDHAGIMYKIDLTFYDIEKDEDVFNRDYETVVYDEALLGEEIPMILDEEQGGYVTRWKSIDGTVQYEYIQETRRLFKKKLKPIPQLVSFFYN